MTDSPLNARRHGRDLHIRDKDLLTGRDCRRLIADALEVYEAGALEVREQETAIRAARIAAHNALPWWQRALVVLSFRREAVACATAPQGASTPTSDTSGTL